MNIYFRTTKMELELCIMIPHFLCFSVPDNPIPMLWESLSLLYSRWLVKGFSSHSRKNSGCSCHFTKEVGGTDGNVPVSCMSYDFRACAKCCAFWKSCVHIRGHHQTVTRCLPVSLHVNQKPVPEKCSAASGMHAAQAYGFFSTENNCRALS